MQKSNNQEIEPGKKSKGVKIKRMHSMFRRGINSQKSNSPLSSSIKTSLFSYYSKQEKIKKKNDSYGFTSTAIPFDSHRSFYTQQALTHSKVLHTASFYHTARICTGKLLHTANAYTQKILHTASIYTEKFFQNGSFETKEAFTL